MPPLFNVTSKGQCTADAEHKLEEAETTLALAAAAAATATADGPGTDELEPVAVGFRVSGLLLILALLDVELMLTNE